jgi:hypothetical protein
MSNTHLEQLGPNARDLAERSLNWMDSCWDEAAGLFQMPNRAFYEDGNVSAEVHLVRETAWYALGLLLRNQPGDAARAGRAVDALLNYQFDAPGEPYHGTWYRSPHEPLPPPGAVVWRDYDPNWREFIGTALAVALIEYPALLPEPLIARIDTALRRAIAGTLARNVPASYTNIALMTAFLLDFGAARFREPAWQAKSEQLAAKILQRFRANRTFDEYNSPTYYAIDLYALALWRSYASAPALRAAGAEMEAALWSDIAQFYHAGMRNLAGPYDRSYGMDMRHYVAGVGMWIWLASGYARAPFPDLSQPFEHAWDFAIAPLVALLGAQIPPEALPYFLAFQGERQVERVIAAEPRRVATAWLGPHLMLGAQDSSSSHIMNEQFHPATAHWQFAGEPLGWLRLRTSAPTDAWAGRGRLSIVCAQPASHDPTFVFQIAAEGVDLAALRHDHWALPGLSVRVETNAASPQVTRNRDLAEIRYTAPADGTNAPVRFTLRFEQEE